MGRRATAALAAAILACAGRATRGDAGLLGLLEEAVAGRQLARAAGAELPVSCAYQDEDGDRDKFCEADQSRAAAPAAGCGCKETCHVWGDPHLSPFYNSCSAHVMGDDGWHSLWSLPTRRGSPGMDIDAYVKRIKKGFWVNQLRVDGVVVMSTDTHCVGRGRNLESTIMRGERMLQSDDALSRDAAADTRIAWTSICDKRHSVMHLNISVTVEQTTLNTPANVASNDVPETTLMFASDTGLCTNPGGDENCERPSDLKYRVGSDGRQCTCNAQCSAFGDPNIHDFNSVQASYGKRFKMPREAAMANSDFHIGRALYMMDQRFAVYVHMNSCDHIVAITVLINKSAKQDMGRNQCRPIGWDPEYPALALTDFEVLKFNANELCTAEADFQAATRKSVVFPSTTSSHYSADVEGYDLGFYGAFEVENPDVRPFTAAQVSRSTTLGSCTLPTGATANFLSYLDMGGVRVTMKCHRTRGTRKARSTAFFNVCLERLMVSEANTKLNMKLNERSFDTAESQLLTSGHCALGQTDISIQSSRVLSSEHRALNQFNFFNIAGDSA